jgi:pimeloyl-ACP methyl ester carboxylesterase
MALPTKSIGVPHLDGSYVSSYVPNGIRSSKPTLVLINSYCTNATLFKPQFSDQVLSNGLNMIAFEPFGHGSSKANSPTYTYWDSAIAFLQALEKLGVKKAFVFGISQGGFIAARMALLAPQMVSPLWFLSPV